MGRHLIPDDIRDLPAEDRLDLISELWDSLDAETETLPLPDWHRGEIDRRIEALDQGNSVGAAWGEVRRRLVSRA